MSEEIDHFSPLNIPGLERIEGSNNYYLLPPYTLEQARVWMYKESASEWNIAAIEVATDLQGQGVGTAMLKAICAAADSQAIKLSLQAQVHKDSHAENARLQAWYECFGFECEDDKRNMSREPKVQPHE